MKEVTSKGAPKKRHQHFIPQTYLKRFSHIREGDTYIVKTSNKQTGETKDLSVRDICVECDFYTISSADDKYAIEDYFSDNIEKKIPLIYKLLVDEKREHLSARERDLVLFTTISMYFRTPKALNEFAEFNARLLLQWQSRSKAESMKFMGYDIAINNKPFKQIKKELKETHRLNYLKEQLALLHQYIKFRKNDGMSVIELLGENEFITSDNPVDITDGNDIGFNLFSTENAIYVPLTPKHVLFIAPQKLGSNNRRVSYHRDNGVLHLTVNYSVYRNAERWIIGTLKGIEQFHVNSDYFFKPASENDPMVLELKERAELVGELFSLMQIGISNNNPELLQFWGKLKTTNHFNDIAFQDCYFKLKNEFGLNI